MAMLKMAFVFNITEVTIKIMNNIFSLDRDDFIIKGKSGTGKSMALILYPTIFNRYIEPFLLTNDLSVIYQYRNPQDFRNLCKIFYIAITQQITPRYVFECLNQQVDKYYRLDRLQSI